ncbi:MAG: hypothetical protein H0T15_07305 [Thermoleophilaceae bacterium]|nr:hypothetical protein [Thermoleophilaceae bacterium]
MNVIGETPHDRHWRLIHRGLPAVCIVLGGAAFLFGAVRGANHVSGGEKSAEAFTKHWQQGDYKGMYAELTPSAKSTTSLASFEQAYETARDIATAAALTAGQPEAEGDVVEVPIAVRTRVFGTIRQPLRVPTEDDKVAWAPNLTFPGVAKGAKLRRKTEAPERAKIVSVDGRTLVTGPASARTSPIGDAGSNIAGEVAPAKTKADKKFLYARGFSRDTPIGQNGLARALEPQLAGRPGGELTAGAKVLARARARPAAEVKSTIDTRIQRAAVAALGDRVGGIAALDAKTAEVRALAGVAFSAPQPPGSTFKIVTTTAALEDDKVKTTDKFPVETKAVIDGVDLENADQESCGGTFAQSFAHSCNSVFGPLGVKVGAKRLVEIAEMYGFNQKPAIPGAQTSTIPQARDFSGPLDVGSSAIGQGRVLATPLEMASIAQTIAARGTRTEPTLGASAEGRPKPTRVTSVKVASQLEKLMIGVVAYGTGTAAKLDGVKVAGKTGTAELESTQGEAAQSPQGEIEQEVGSNTDAWFTAYAPVKRPKVAVAALFVRAEGSGGEVAAPAVKTVLQAALKAD